jgi:hypothetical protein
MYAFSERRFSLPRFAKIVRSSVRILVRRRLKKFSTAENVTFEFWYFQIDGILNQ